SQFKQYSDGTFGFQIGEYDHNKPLIIDPVVYSTLYGAQGGVDDIFSVQVDQFEQPYISGSTNTRTFPTSPGAYNRTINNLSIFVAKLTADAAHYIYSTVINSTGAGIGTSIAIDSTGHAYVAGSILDPTLPTTSNAI